MQLRTDSDKRELKSHGSYEFPVFVSYERLSEYERGAFSWHWHPEIELTLIQEGRMIYQVNEQIWQLEEGQGLFCNTNALHAGHMAAGEDCRYLAVTFHPRMIYGFENSLVQRELVDPILRNPALASVVITREAPWGRDILEALCRLEQDVREEKPSCPLLVQERLAFIWRRLFESGCAAQTAETSAAHGRDVERIRNALNYLHSHYAEHITLEQVAEQMHLCRSESCRFFKKYMKQSVFDYLRSYRLEKSIGLLADPELPVTEAALKAGFSSPAYFSKVFREQLGVTPMQYRHKSAERAGKYDVWK